MGNLARVNFFNPAVYMANSEFRLKSGYKQRKSNRLSIHHTGNALQLPGFKRYMDMAEIKWTLSLIANIIGVPLYIGGILSNLDNVKSSILFLIALIFGMAKTYFYIVQKRQAVRDKEIDIWHKQQDQQERKNKTK